MNHKIIGVLLCMVAGLVNAQTGSEEKLRSEWRARLLQPLQIHDNSIVHDSPFISPLEKKRLMEKAVPAMKHFFPENIRNEGSKGYPIFDIYSIKEILDPQGEAPAMLGLPAIYSENFISYHDGDHNSGLGSFNTFQQNIPSWLISSMDAELEAYSLVKGKTNPVFNNISRIDVPFAPADVAMVWAGPAVREGATRYWQASGKTHIRIPFNENALHLYHWAAAHKLPLQLVRRQGNSAVATYLSNHHLAQQSNSLIVDATTDIPVFVVAPEGLLPARITAFSVGGSSCDGSNWVELVLEDAANPEVWGVLALNDPQLTKNIEVTQLPTVEMPMVRMRPLGIAGSTPTPSVDETQRKVLRVDFMDNALPTLYLVARHFDWIDREVIVKENGEEREWIQGEILDSGSTWGTQVRMAKDSQAIPATSWADRHLSGQVVSELGAPRCSPP